MPSTAKKASSPPRKSRRRASASPAAPCSSTPAASNPRPPTATARSPPTPTVRSRGRSGDSRPAKPYRCSRFPTARGWEMVSPVDKNGGSIQNFGQTFGGGVFQAAAQGAQFTYTSASSFANPTGAPGSGQYVSRRGASGVEHGERHPAGGGRGRLSRIAHERCPVPDLFHRPDQRAAQQRSPLPDHRIQPMPGRKPAPGGIGSPGRLSQLLHARQLERIRQRTVEERRPRPPRARCRGFRTGLRRSNPRPLPRGAHHLRGSDDGRHRNRRQRRRMRREQTEPLHEVRLGASEADQPAPGRLHRHSGRDAGRAEPGDLNRRLPRVLDQWDQPLSARRRPDETGRPSAGGRGDVRDRHPRRLRCLLHQGRPPLALSRRHECRHRRNARRWGGGSPRRLR